MSIDINDPRLTAYALGELDDNERRVIESELENSPEARRVIEETSKTAETLTVELQAEPAPALSESQRQDIQSAAESARQGSDSSAAALTPKVAKLRWSVLRIAAAIVIVAGVGWGVILPSLEATRKAARIERLATTQVGRDGEIARSPSVPARPSSAGQGRLQELVALGYVPQPSVQSYAVGDEAMPEPGANVLLQDGHAEFVRGSIADVEVEVGALLVTAGESGPDPLMSRQLDGLGYATQTDKDTANFGYEVPLKTTQPDNSPQPNRVNRTKGRPGSGGAGGGQGGTGPIFGSYTGVSDDLLARREQWLASLARKRGTKGKGSPGGGRGREPLYDLGYAGGIPDDGRWMDPAIYTQRLLLPRSESSLGGESYDPIVENPFRLVTQNPLSTFSIDVDTASYSNIRRHLNFDQWPPAGSVRIEEMVNYFDYDYPQPEGDDPFGVDIVVASCPWREEHRLVRVGLKGYELEANERPMANLVFLLDVSGSMNNPYKLPLVKESMRMLVENLSGDDYVAIVVYAGAAGEVLPSTSAANQGEILEAIDNLRSGGSTNAGDGIQLAYQIADDNFIEGGINRVILATDGDFNVGITNRGALDRLITEEAKKGVFLTVLGFGMGNLKDSTMESLADKGNGNYAYIDSSNEAHKVLVEQLSGTLVTIAKDVKIQIEFNPAQVTAYRLIGYENRILAAQDFNDDRKDAGEIGAGHTVTALYEVVPVGVELDAPSIDPLKYQPVAEDDSETAAEDGEYDSEETGQDDVEPADNDVDEPSDAADFVPAEFSHELLTLKLRYKQPDGDTSTLMEYPVIDDGGRYVDAGEDFQFAAAVASFGMLLRDSSYKGDATFDSVYEMAESGLGEDYYGYRAEFLELIDKASELAPLDRVSSP